MKKLLLLLTTIALLVSCQGEQKSNAIELVDGTSTSQTIYANETSKSDGIRFTAQAPWTATVAATKSGVEWLTLSQTSGKAGTFTLGLTLQENTSGTSRKAEIRIVCDGLTIVITVEQKATPRPGDPEEPSEITPFIKSNGELLGTEILGEYTVSKLSYRIVAFGAFNLNSYESDKEVAYENKRFDMTLATPPSDVMVLPNNSFASPSDVKLAWTPYLDEVSEPKEASAAITLTNVSYSNAIDRMYAFRKGDAIIVFVYASKDATLNGSLTEDLSGLVGNLSYTTMRFSNQQIKQGWNAIVCTAISDADNIGQVDMQAEYLNGASMAFRWVVRQAEYSDNTNSLKVKAVSYNGTKEPIRYGSDGRVVAIGDNIYYGNGATYGVKEDNNGLLYIEPIQSNPWRFEYEINDQKMLSSVKYYQTRTSDIETGWAKFSYDLNGNMFSAYGQQRGVTQNIGIHADYQENNFVKSNFDIAYFLMTRELFVDHMIDSYDQRAGKISSALPTKITLKGDNTDKYDGEFTYRYVRNQIGLVTHVYERKNNGSEYLILAMEY